MNTSNESTRLNDAQQPDLPVQAETFEQALKALEAVVSRLREQLPLQESLDLYQRGLDLEAKCRAFLEQAQAQIAQWNTQMGEEQPFQGDDQQTQATHF